MATNLNSFVSETLLPSVTTTLISAGSSEKKFLGVITLTNTTASNVEVTLWRIPTASTETTGAGGNWIYRETIPAGATVKVQKLSGHVIDNSMKLSGVAATASAVNIDISGTTEV